MNAAELIAKVPSLPAPSTSVTRLSQLLASPDADTHEIIKVVSQDGVMSAKLLGLCNSAAYALSSPVSSIDHAVIVLGLDQIHRLVMSVGFGGALSGALGGYAICAGELWRHSLITAHVAVLICNKARPAGIAPSVAYTAALVHDIGKSVFTHVLDEASQVAIRDLIERKKCSFSEAEQQVIGTDHAQVGECLLRSWGLPEVLVEAVANHHQPVIKPSPQLSAVVHVADVIAHEVGPSPGWSSFAMRVDENAVTALGIGALDVERLIMATSDEARKIEAMVASTK